MITAGVGVCVRFTPDRGRGVFATKTFEYGDLIEKCPVIVLSWYVTDMNGPKATDKID
jgi:hypothetical protein